MKVIKKNKERQGAKQRKEDGKANKQKGQKMKSRKSVKEKGQRNNESRKYGKKRGITRKG